jgi:hypothetical protein
MIARRISVFALVGALAAQAAGPRAAAADDQLRFSADDKTVHNPVPIPPAIMAILAQDGLVRSLHDNPESPVSGAAMADWFLASPVHLGAPAETDLVVIGAGPLRSATLVMFWVFRITGAKPQLILRTGGHDLILLPSRSHGLVDIETDSVTAEQIGDYLFRFDGAAYQLAHKTASRGHS